jgi:5-methylcytosine-specific restriction enzyme B
MKIWFALKHMGMEVGGAPVMVDTGNSTPSLKRLFEYGHPEGDFFVPFAHTPRYKTMKADASRSIVQTNINRWATSNSVVTCNPTGFLDCRAIPDGSLTVAPGRAYPMGLGYGEDGFALEDGQRSAIPLGAFAAWFGRSTDIPANVDALQYLIEDLRRCLHLSPGEEELVFVADDGFLPTVQTARLTDSEVFNICRQRIGMSAAEATVELAEDPAAYAARARATTSGIGKPAWAREAPERVLGRLLEDGERSLLLYGPPRTGKTRAIDSLYSRNDPSRATIQIHDGWGYDHLVEGLKPDSSGNWAWRSGPLKAAIDGGKKVIVLEEVNRTQISQSLGEVFSLIESAYRGPLYAISLRSGQTFSVPEDVVFFMTMNTVDKSTEDLDDALLGRVAAVEFPPRPEDLMALLGDRKLLPAIQESLLRVYGEVLKSYPLGHGYFAGLREGSDGKAILAYYLARIRPVLVNYHGELNRHEVDAIDNVFDAEFSV